MDTEVLIDFRAALAKTTPADLKVLLLRGGRGPNTSKLVIEAMNRHPSYVSARFALLGEQGLVAKATVATRPGGLSSRFGWEIAPKFEAALTKIAGTFDINNRNRGKVSRGRVRLS